MLLSGTRVGYTDPVVRARKILAPAAGSSLRFVIDRTMNLDWLAIHIEPVSGGSPADLNTAGGGIYADAKSQDSPCLSAHTESTQIQKWLIRSSPDPVQGLQLLSKQ